MKIYPSQVLSTLILTLRMQDILWNCLQEMQYFQRPWRAVRARPQTLALKVESHKFRELFCDLETCLPFTFPSLRFNFASLLTNCVTSFLHLGTPPPFKVIQFNDTTEFRCIIRTELPQQKPLNACICNSPTRYQYPESLPLMTL